MVQPWLSECRWDLVDLVEGEGRRVLDVGCWTGETLEGLRSRGHVVEGLDVLDERKVALDVPFHRIDLNSYDGIERELSGFPLFDYVVIGDVLEHLTCPSLALRAFAWRVVNRNGGRIVVSVPNLGWIGSLLHLVKGDSLRADTGTFDRGHLRMYNAVTLRDELQDAGFRVLDMKYKQFEGTQPWPVEGVAHVFQWENVAIECNRGMYDALNAYQILAVAEVV